MESSADEIELLLADLRSFVHFAIGKVRNSSSAARRPETAFLRFSVDEVEIEREKPGAGTHVASEVVLAGNFVAGVTVESGKQKENAAKSAEITIKSRELTLVVVLWL